MNQDQMNSACSSEAHPVITPISMTNGPGDNRLVVIVLRGGMDGLSAIQPYGDPHFAGMRARLAQEEAKGAADLDGFFALHQALSPLMDLWQKKELSFAHAVSTPYRDKRSHFDGQDLLEAGTLNLAPANEREGWLNRMLQGFGNLKAETAFSIGRSNLPILAGEAPVSQWAPTADLVIPSKALKETRALMKGHPLFANALDQAMHLADQSHAHGDMSLEDVQKAMNKQVNGSRDTQAIARFASQRLLGETRIAAFSIAGWDTHANQAVNLSKMLDQLAATILTIRNELGSVWDRTTVVAMTEFGRMVQTNGTDGTDHGTGGAMLFAGGALNGGRVVTEWPGLESSDLYDGRDLNSTRDVRSLTAWVMRSLYGFDKTFLETVVFPGMEMGDDPKIIS
ncbi:DUF1501 domain-containing protein [uncultured Pelagimonas sp.]|uniref:DUF1501 domain-containing protein n=1 Tax=uncultured Pelagimonas sp. TaxID=1618102 RepID=UPI002623E69F|nr:DUF1501 domain-containing protein [uncultured Pelagimonas sp.]